MILNLEESNSKQRNSHRSRIIENAFQGSSQHQYRMPRSFSVSSHTPESDIPSIYNLHHQNLQKELATIIPIHQLVRMNSMTQKHQSLLFSPQRGLSSQDVLFSKESGRSRRNKLECTMSKRFSREGANNKALQQSWLCCDRDDLQMFETKEMLIFSEQKKKRGMLLGTKR